MTPVLSRLLVRLSVPAAGAILGILAVLLGEVDSTAAHVVYLVLAAGWTWAAFAFCVGLSQAGKTKSVLLASASLLVAVVAYYMAKLGRGDFLEADVKDLSGQGRQVAWYGFWSKTVAWSVVACITGPLLGLAGNLARNNGFHGLPFRLLVPLVALVDTSQRLDFEASLQGPVAEATWSITRLLAVAVAAVLAGKTVADWWARHSARCVRR